MRRLAAVRSEMARREIDALVVDNAAILHISRVTPAFRR